MSGLNQHCSINWLNIFTNARYSQVNLARHEVVLWASNAGIDNNIKKSNVLTLEEEQLTLTQSICQPTFLASLNLKFGYFCI
jgi:hypothetical protein